MGATIRVAVSVLIPAWVPVTSGTSAGPKISQNFWVPLKLFWVPLSWAGGAVRVV
jgi:hypothetical protein